MLRTLANLRAIDIGFRPDHLLAVRTILPTTRYATGAARQAFYDRVVEQTRALPGVESAAYASMLPFQSIGNTTWFQIEGVALDPTNPVDALLRAGTSDYLKTLGAQIVEGRLSDERDSADAPKVLVINDTMAKQYWPGASALGHRVRIGSTQPYYAIVGVVRDLKERG